MSLTKLKEAIEKRVNIILNLYIDWLDVVGVLGINVFVRDMTRGLARRLGSKSGGVLDRHFVEKLFLVTGVHAIRKLDLAKIRQLDHDGGLLFIIFDRVQLAEKIGRDGGERGRSGSWTKLSASRLPASFGRSDEQVSLRGHAGLNKGLG